jgi:hypothetical protein
MIKQACELQACGSGVNLKTAYELLKARGENGFVVACENLAKGHEPQESFNFELA